MHELLRHWSPEKGMHKRDKTMGPSCVDFISDNDHIQDEDFGYWMRKSREYIRAQPELFQCPDEVDMDDLNLDSNNEEDSDSNDTSTTTVTATNVPQSPNVITKNPISSVSNFVSSLETQKAQNQSKEQDQSQPTGEKPKRGRPKGETSKKKK